MLKTFSPKAHRLWPQTHRSLAGTPIRHQRNIDMGGVAAAARHVSWSSQSCACPPAFGDTRGFRRLGVTGHRSEEMLRTP